MTFPNLHCPRGSLLSTTMTISFTFKFVTGYNHFRRLWSNGNISRFQRSQKCLSSSCILRQRFRIEHWISSTEGGASLPPMRPRRKLFGVSTGSSFTSELGGVNGRELTSSSEQQKSGILHLKLRHLWQQLCAETEFRKGRHHLIVRFTFVDLAPRTIPSHCFSNADDPKMFSERRDNGITSYTVSHSVVNFLDYQSRNIMFSW